MTRQRETNEYYTREKQKIQCMIRHRPMNVHEIANVTGHQYTTVKRWLNEMDERGFVTLNHGVAYTTDENHPVYHPKKTKREKTTKKNSRKSVAHYERAKEILVNNLKTGEPITARNLAIRCDVHKQTIKNWLEEIIEAGFVEITDKDKEEYRMIRQPYTVEDKGKVDIEELKTTREVAQNHLNSLRNKTLDAMKMMISHIDDNEDRLFRMLIAKRNLEDMTWTNPGNLLRNIQSARDAMKDEDGNRPEVKNASTFLFQAVACASRIIEIDTIMGVLE